MNFSLNIHRVTNIRVSAVREQPGHTNQVYAKIETT